MSMRTRKIEQPRVKTAVGNWDRRWSAFALAMVIVSAAIKLYWTYAAPLSPDFSDAYGYHNFAVRVVEHHTYFSLDAIFKPGMPFFLTAVYSIFGPDYHYGRIALIFVSLIFSWYVYRFAGRIAGETAGRIAFTMSLIDPFIVHYTTSEFGELLMFTFTMVSLYYCLVNAETPRWRYVVFIGAATAAATMFKAWINVIFPIYSVYVVVLHGRGAWRRAALELVALVAVFYLTLSPWLVFGYYKTGHFVLDLSSGPAMLFYGNNPLAIPELPDSEKVTEMNKLIPADLHTDTLEFNRLAKAYVVNYILTHPYATFRKFLTFFVRYWSHPNRLWHQRAVDYFEPVITWLWCKWLLAVIGCAFLARRDPKKLFLPGVFAMAATGVYGLTAYLGRYKDILLPIQLAFSAAGVIVILEIFRQPFALQSVLSDELPKKHVSGKK